jgi:hypothetical protein
VILITCYFIHYDTRELFHNIASKALETNCLAERTPAADPKDIVMGVKLAGLMQVSTYCHILYRNKALLNEKGKTKRVLEQIRESALRTKCVSPSDSHIWRALCFPFINLKKLKAFF